MLIQFSNKIMFSTSTKILIARVISLFLIRIRRFANLNPVTVVRRGGLYWELDLEEGIDLSIYLLGSFEPSTLVAYSSIVKEGDVVFDIGANIGSHTLPLAKLVGITGKVFSFEPTLFAYQKQLRNLALNEHLAERVIAKQLMLVGDGELDLPDHVHSSWPLKKTHNLHAGHLGALKSTLGSSAVSLDYFVDTEMITKVDFIKLDVDGYELDVLGGATKCLMRFHPRVLLELAPYVFYDGATTFDDLLNYFFNLGYRFYSIRSLRPLGLDIKSIEREIPKNGSINVLAIFGHLG